MEKITEAEAEAHRLKRTLARTATTTRIRIDYWREVWKSHGFDVKRIEPKPFNCMGVFKCKSNDCPLLVRLYAKMGLHRYNMLEGTDLQLHRVEKYNVSEPLRPSGYYITLVARDPATRSLKSFQTCIRQGECNQMDLKCCIARITKRRTQGTFNHDVIRCQFGRFSVPKWPEDDALADESRFYVVPESEWHENDWIRLYLDLAFVTTNRGIDNPKLSDLNIVEVVVESSDKEQPPNAKLKEAKDVIVYIKYDQDLGDGGLCKRRAFVIRSVDLKTGRLSLMGGDYLDQPTDSAEHEVQLNK